MAPGSVNPNFSKIYISAAITLVNHLKFFIKKNNGNQLSLTTALYRDLLTVHWFALYFCDGQKSHSVAEDNPMSDNCCKIYIRDDKLLLNIAYFSRLWIQVNSLKHLHQAIFNWNWENFLIQFRKHSVRTPSFCFRWL